MPSAKLLAAAGAVLVAGAAGYWWYASRPEPVVGTIARAPAPAVESPPAIEHPVPAAPTAEPLPPLAESDGALRKRLEALASNERALGAIRPDRVARRFVATVDALTREGVPIDLRSLAPVPGRLVVGGTDEAAVLDPKNGERYEPYVQWLEQMDAARVGETYREVYPLLQGAYEELGYPNRYFNDRLVRVIDDLLATPDVKEPIALARPHVLYTFADPSLERRSAGQKAMLRLGHERAARVKSKLKEIRAVLVAEQAAER